MCYVIDNDGTKRHKKKKNISEFQIFIYVANSMLLTLFRLDADRFFHLSYLIHCVIDLSLKCLNHVTLSFWFYCIRLGGLRLIGLCY